MSFEIAMSGINAVSGSLEAISNNIANTGTLGYKSSRADFSSMVAGSQAAGAELSSTSRSIEQAGGLMSTGRGMDAMIQGRGFFAMREASGQVVYSRVGSFDVNKDGFVVDKLGRKVQGFAPVLDASGKPVAGAALGALGDLKVANGQIAAQASDALKFSGNLSADWHTPATATFNPADNTSFNHSVTSVVFDSLGAKHSLTQYFIKQGAPANTVATQYSFDGGAPSAGPTLSFDGNGQLPSPAPSGVLAVPATALNGAAALNVKVDYTGTTLFSGDSTTLANSANGYSAGTLTGTSLSADGSLVASYSNGQKQAVGTVAVATFANEGALTAGNDTSFEANDNTGAPLYARPGSAQAAKLSTGALEQSNVDMTGELVHLMAAQRNYQANTKVISAENEMIQKLLQAI